MKPLEFPAFRQDGSKIMLSEILDQIPQNNWTWSIWEFDGIGKPPLGLSMTEFNQVALSRGVLMTWQEVKSFAHSLLDIHFCLLIATIQEKQLTIKEVEKENFENYDMVIYAFDSTEWKVWSHNENILNLIRTKVSEPHKN
uniref:hypothetical protein n=1 Tax=Leptospira interrogans TaxID=173 RepID=UPI0039C90028